jgi:CRP-like cAMP-binding protein
MESRYFSYCQEAPGRHIQCLSKVSEELVHDAGQIIVPSGRTADGVYVLMSGNARIVYVSRGLETPVQAVVGIMGPGDLFGLIPALDGGNYQAQLEALQPPSGH